MKTERWHWKTVIGIGGIMFTMTAFWALSFWLSSRLFHVTGTPPPLARFLLTSWTGFALFWLVAFGLHSICSDRVRNRGHHNRTLLLAAMSRIASGDFRVFIPPENCGMHYEIAAGLNEMARDLRDLEAMRQDFISNVSHEIQSPLTSVKGFASLLKKKGLSGEQQQHYASIIEAESERLSSLSDNLLRLSALEAQDMPPSKQEYRLDKQIESIVLTMEPQWAAKNITVEADLPKTVYHGDEGLLAQAWEGLLNNAVKFTPPGGTINVELRSDSENIHFTVSDTGIGIPKHDKMRVFERFYKVDKSRDRSRGGSGLGLSIVRKIIELHGGGITVESAVHKGATFQIALPRLHSV